MATKINLPLPNIDLVKVTGEIVIPQKALSKIEERGAMPGPAYWSGKKGNSGQSCSLMMP